LGGLCWIICDAFVLALAFLQCGDGELASSAPCRPNQRYTRWTAWENALRYVCVTKDPLDQDQWVRIFELLIENGADRNAFYEGPSPTGQGIEMHSALSIIDKIFDSRANSLREVLKKKRPESLNVGTGASDVSRPLSPLEEGDKTGEAAMKPLALTIGWRRLLCCGLAR
jgi:hypothetical protein